MKIPILVKWISIIIVIFTSLVLPLTLLETSLSRYSSDALDWAGNNESLISMIVILALMLMLFSRFQMVLLILWQAHP